MKSFGTKVQKVSQTITPFGGISFVNNAFNQVGLSKLIDNELGIRAHGMGYRYSEIIRNLFNIFFCGGDCAEDIQTHLREALENIPGNSVPSADTLLRGIKELAVANTTVESVSGKKYNFNINDNINGLNIKSLLLTNQLKSGEKYDLDYDNQIIAHNKWDARPTYKKTEGYFPGVATIGDKIVYIENRDGNANVKTDQAQTLERVYQSLEKEGIHIRRSRMDAGSYSKEIVETVAAHSEKFYIRANKCGSLYETVCKIDNWKAVEINCKLYEVATIGFKQFLEEENYRLVVMREKSADKQLDLFTGQKFVYRCILTDDWDGSEKEVIEYYNQRGGSEKTFDIQNNDFGWGHLPCSDMDANTVYLIIMAMAKNFYNYIIGIVSKVFKDIAPGSRLKRFIFRFISVAGKWVYQGRQWILHLYSQRPYEKLCF